MRILFVYDSLSSIGGGSQIAVLTWFKNLKKAGLKVKLYCNQNNITLSEEITRDDLITENAINLNLLFPEFSVTPFLSQKNKKIISKYKPQIIHLHEPSLIAYQFIEFAKKNQIKTIVSYHTNFSQFEISQFPFSLFIRKNGVLNWLISKFQYFLLKISDYTTTPSFFYQKLLSKTLQKKPFYLPYPLSKEFFLKSDRCQQKKINKIITIGRLSGEKNLDLLLQMMFLLKDRFYLTVVGDGVDRRLLEAKSKKLNKSIKFTGWIKHGDLPKIIRKHHLFVSFSNFETFGIAYIEALASRIPCLAYDYPVSREIIPEDMAIFMNTLAPMKWAEKLIEIQKNPLIYQKLKENLNNNYHNIYQYHEMQSTKKLIEIYNKILLH